MPAGGRGMEPVCVAGRSGEGRYFEVVEVIVFASFQSRGGANEVFPIIEHRYLLPVFLLWGRISGGSFYFDPIAADARAAGLSRPQF